MSEMTATASVEQALDTPRQSLLAGFNPGFIVMIGVGLLLIVSTFIAPAATIPYIGGAGVLLVLSGWILGRHLSARSWVTSFLVLFVPGINGPLAVLTCLMLAAIGIGVAGGHNLMETKAPAEVAKAQRPQNYVPVQTGVDPTGRPTYAQPLNFVQQSGHLNTLALLAMIFGILGGLAAIPLGHIALSQIKRTGDSGRGMAIAGLILGYVSAAVLVVIFIVYLSLVASLS